MKFDLLSVLEAAYAPAASDEAWLARLLEVTAPAMDHGLGAVATICEISKNGDSRFAPPIATSPEAARFARIAGRAEKEPNTEGIAAKLWLRGDAYGTASRKSGLDSDWPRHPAIAKHHVPLGVRDALGLVAIDPSGHGCAILAPLPRVWSPPRREIEVWSRVATHIAAGLRLRRASTGADTHGAEAIVSPSGKVEHAGAHARSKEARALLARGVRASERARGPMRRVEPREAVGIWRALIAGRWSLVDSFDHDGRRFVIARRNDPTIETWQSLSARERQVVAFAALGHSNKLIAYALGISVSAVGMLMSRAAAKVGAKSRIALIQAYSARAPKRR